LVQRKWGINGDLRHSSILWVRPRVARTRINYAPTRQGAPARGTNTLSIGKPQCGKKEVEISFGKKTGANLTFHTVLWAAGPKKEVAGAGVRFVKTDPLSPAVRAKGKHHPNDAKSRLTGGPATK